MGDTGHAGVIGPTLGSAALSVLREEVARRQAEWREEERQRRCPTGVASLDRLLEGGFGRGLVSVLGGIAGSGRTSVAARAVATATQAGDLCAWVDPGAGSLSARGLLATGVRLDRLLHVTPPVGDTAWAAQLLARCPAFALVVVDVDAWLGREGRSRGNTPGAAQVEAALHRLADAARAGGPAVVLLAPDRLALPAAFRARLFPEFSSVDGTARGVAKVVPLVRSAVPPTSEAPSVVAPSDAGLLRPSGAESLRFRLVCAVEKTRRAPPPPAEVSLSELVAEPIPRTFRGRPDVDGRGRRLRARPGPAREGFGEVVVRPLAQKVHEHAPARFDPDRTPPPLPPGDGQWSIELPLRPRAAGGAS